MRKGIVGAAILLLVAERVTLLIVALDQQRTSYDVNRYFQIVDGGVPYRDQAVEYPPIAVGLLEFLHVIGPGRQAFGIAVVVCMAAAEALLCLLMWRVFGGRIGVAFLILSSPLYYLLLTRIDIISAALAALYVALALRARSFSAGVAWAGAVGAKLWAFPLGAYMITIRSEPSARRRALLGSVTSVVVVGGSWLALGGFGGIRDVLTSRGAHGWQIESVGGSLLRALGAGPVYGEGGSNRIGQVPPGLGLTMTLVGGVAAISVCWWAGRRGLPGTGWVSAVMCLLATSTLLSPQFVTWAVPGAALAIRESRRWVVAAVAVTIVLTLGESAYYRGVLDGAPLAQALLVMRNAAVVGTVVVGIRSLARRT
jgi:hypothetical protein